MKIPALFFTILLRRKRSSEWVGGYEESPRKQLAVADRDDRPASYVSRDQGGQNPFMQPMHRYDAPPGGYAGGQGPVADDTMARGVLNLSRWKSCGEHELNTVQRSSMEFILSSVFNQCSRSFLLWLQGHHKQHLRREVTSSETVVARWVTTERRIVQVAASVTRGMFTATTFPPQSILHKCLTSLSPKEANACRLVVRGLPL